MRLILSVPAILSIALLLSAQDAGRGGPPAAPAARAMTLTIPGFPDGGQIPVKFSQAAPGVAPGEGTSPAMIGIGAAVTRRPLPHHRAYGSVHGGSSRLR